MTNTQESYILPECCNKCRELDGFLGAKGCSNRECECHKETPTPTVKEVATAYKNPTISTEIG